MPGRFVNVGQAYSLLKKKLKIFNLRRKPNIVTKIIEENKMSLIHKTSIIDPKAKIAENVKIGPFCIVGPNVTIGAGSELVSHCTIDGYTTIGEKNIFSPFVAIGQPPQDVDWDAQRSYIKIGDNNQFREGFTAHPGTTPESTTTIGDNCLFMNHSHVAHNCTVENNVILVNSALIAGYVTVGEKAIISGNAAVHQFCRVGRLVMLAGNSAIAKDLPPFMMYASHNKSHATALNLIGMRRSGFSNETIRKIKRVYGFFFLKNLNRKDAIEAIRAEDELYKTPEVKEFVDFVESAKRGIIKSVSNVIKE